MSGDERGNGTGERNVGGSTVRNRMMISATAAGVLGMLLAGQAQPVSKTPNLLYIFPDQFFEAVSLETDFFYHQTSDWSLRTNNILKKQHFNC